MAGSNSPASKKRKKVRVKEDNPIELPSTTKELVAEVAVMKSHKKELEEEIEKKQAEIIEQMEMCKVQTVKISHPSASLSITATVVKGTTPILDHERFRKLVGATTWNSLCSKVFDRDKLESRIAEGKVSKETVSRCTELKARKSFLKITWG